MTLAADPVLLLTPATPRTCVRQSASDVWKRCWFPRMSVSSLSLEGGEDSAGAPQGPFRQFSWFWWSLWGFLQVRSWLPAGTVRFFPADLEASFLLLPLAWPGLRLQTEQTWRTWVGMPTPDLREAPAFLCLVTRTVHLHLTCYKRTLNSVKHLFYIKNHVIVHRCRCPPLCCWGTTWLACAGRGTPGGAPLGHREACSQRALPLAHCCSLGFLQVHGGLRPEACLPHSVGSTSTPRTGHSLPCR